MEPQLPFLLSPIFSPTEWNDQLLAPFSSPFLCCLDFAHAFPLLYGMAVMVLLFDQKNALLPVSEGMTSFLCGRCVVGAVFVFPAVRDGLPSFA